MARLTGPYAGYPGDSTRRTTTQELPLGTVAQAEGGKEYAYVQANGAIIAGSGVKLAQSGTAPYDVVYTTDIADQLFGVAEEAFLIECPIAHGEGNFQVNDNFPLSSLLSRDQIALLYVCPDGSPAKGEYPMNPNGSLHDIAGICNPQGNVLGLMPHPKNHIHPHQHPLRTRGIQRGSGLQLFRNGVKFAGEI